MGEGSAVFALLSLASKREGERGRERESERGRLVSHMWKKSLAVRTRVSSAPGIISVRSDLMEEKQA